MRTTTWIVLAIVLVSAVAVQSLADSTADKLPEFTHKEPQDWLNSDPLRVADLRGQVVLIDFWTFECWNCYRSFPWLNAVDQRFASQGLKVVGVHSPEFEHEHDVDRVKAKVAEFALQHPVMIDNDFSYWKALKNRFWPAFYLVDKYGTIRGRFIGETHVGDKQAETIEQLITALLAEQYD